MRARFCRALLAVSSAMGAAAVASAIAAGPARAESANPLHDPGILRVREAFTVDGIALFDPHAQHAARMGVCAASVFANLKWCVSGTGEETRGDATYVKTTGYNIDPDNRIVYAISTRRGYPLKADGFDAVVQSITARAGTGAAVHALRFKGADGADAISVIAVWGGLRLVHLTESEYAVVESGGSLKRGHLVDHRFNLAFSAKAREPVYKIEGEAGYILHFMQTGPERADIVARVAYAPAFVPSTKPADVPANPLSTDAVKSPRPAATRTPDREGAADRARRIEAERALAAEKLLREDAERKLEEMKRALEELKKRSAVEAKPDPRAEAERKADAARRAEAEKKAEAERRAEADRSAAAEKEAAAKKAEAERVQREDAERLGEEARKAEAERQVEAAKRAEAERQAREDADRLAMEARKAEIEHANRVAALRKAEEEKRAREEAERKALAERKAAEAARERAEAERRGTDAVPQGGPEQRTKPEDDAEQRRESERRDREARRVEAERRAEAARVARDRASRTEDWYRQAAAAAARVGANWSGGDSADERRAMAQAIFSGNGGAGIEIVFECTLGTDRRIRATARGFDRNTGARVPFNSDGQGAFRVATRIARDGGPAEDGSLLRESDDDMVSILEVPSVSGETASRAARAEAWLRHHVITIEFRLMAGTVSATVAPYAPNLRKVLEACARP